VSTRKTGESIIKFEHDWPNTLALTSGNTIEFERKREFYLLLELYKKNPYLFTGYEATSVSFDKYTLFFSVHGLKTTFGKAFLVRPLEIVSKFE